MKTEGVTVTLPLEEYVKLCKQADDNKPKLAAGADKVVNALAGQLRHNGFYREADLLECHRKEILEAIQL
jgi:hypothetical protein